MTRRWIWWFILVSLFTLAGCGGTLSVSFDVTPTPGLAQQATVSALEERIATLEPMFRPLDMNADDAAIRAAMLDSQRSWQTSWIDMFLTSYAGSKGIKSERVQMWVDRASGQFRVITGPNEGQPYTIQLGDGMTQERVNLMDGTRQTQQMQANARDLNWTAPREVSDTIEPHPLDLEIDSPAATMVFSTEFAQQGGVYVPTGMEKVAGRPALVAERQEDGKTVDRLWIDTRTGIVLRWQHWDKDSTLNRPVMEGLTLGLELDAQLPPELFDLRIGERPRFAQDASGQAGPTPVPPDTAYEAGAGALYYVLWSPGESPELQLERLPGNCVTGPDACPAPQVVPGFPNQNNTIEPLIWSPQGDAALLNQQGTLYRYSPANEEWKALAQFPALRSPVWSKDGQWIAFIGQDTQDQHDLYVIRRDGTDLQNLTNGQFHGQESFLWVEDWMADGRILFHHTEQVYTNLFAIRMGDAAATQVFLPTLMNAVAALAPGGEQLAYSSANEAGGSLFLTQLQNTGSFEGEERVTTF